MKKIALFLCLSLACSAYAQNLLQQGRDSQEIVPQGWDKIEAQGDLNQDGKTDLVVFTKPHTPEKTKPNNDISAENDFNQGLLAIYFGQDNGTFKLFKQYKELLFASELTHIDVGLKINRKGSLLIDIKADYVYGVGGIHDSYQYNYRYQNQDFYLIGKDVEKMDSHADKLEKSSENYLTGKKLVITDKALEGGWRKEKWHKLNKKPLEKLGKDALYVD